MPVVPGTPCVLCAPEEAARKPLPGSVKTVPCVGCRRRVLAAASTRELVAAGQAQPVCIDCLPPGVHVPVMTAAQASELRVFDAEDARRN